MNFRQKLLGSGRMVGNTTKKGLKNPNPKISWNFVGDANQRGPTYRGTLSENQIEVMNNNTK